METDSENQRPGHCEIISVPRKDTVRLLEVYIKRSISLNYGGPVEKKAGKKEKWVTMSKTLRRSSSDPSLHLHERLNDRESVFLPAAEPHTNEPMRDHEEPDKPTIKSKKSKKSKKPSLWKAFLGFFKNDDKDDERESPSEVRDEAAQSTNRSLRTHASSQKSLRMKSLKRKLSKRLSIRSSRFNTDLQNTDSAGVEAVISVEPTYSYYEKVSEELEKIVHEVQEKEETETLSNEEVIRRIVALTIQEGDAINGKLKDNPALNSFFQGISYSSFQKLADAYIEKEATPTHKPPTVLPTAPELVKLAFTLDFTARIAGLSKQNVGHITYLGHRYLQDRFEYRQACTDHPWSDSDDIDGVAVTDKQN